MASKQIQCEVCCNEIAVGYCKTCGNVGETCIDIHKTGKMFKTHIVSTNKEHNENNNSTKRDITEERCKQHSTEKAIYLCKNHDSMICRRCLYSDHRPCVREVVDLLLEAVTVDSEKVNTMKSVLKKVKDEIQLLRDEAEASRKRSKNNADKCIQDCKEIGNKINQRVDKVTSDIRDRILKRHDENTSKLSQISESFDEKTKWCENEERKIDDFVDNNMAGYLYLMSRKFDKEVSDARSQVKTIKDKLTLKLFDFKENKVILRCVFEDLEEVCEQDEAVVDSDDGNAIGFTPSADMKTRRELNALLNQAKPEFNSKEQLARMYDKGPTFRRPKGMPTSCQRKYQKFISEVYRTRHERCDEVEQVKQDLANAEKARPNDEVELKRTKEDLDRVKRERAILLSKLLRIKECYEWTQPKGTAEVKSNLDGTLEVIFTFEDGIQTKNHPCPGDPYKGDTFVGHLLNNFEGMRVCKMLKQAFMNGVLFTVGRDDGRVRLDGVSLNNCMVSSDYAEYIETVKHQLVAKGIELEDMIRLGGPNKFVVDGSFMLEFRLDELKELIVKA